MRQEMSAPRGPSQCSKRPQRLQSITWWLDLLRAHCVRLLMIAPNARRSGGTRLLSWEQDGSQVDFQREIESRGYRLVVREPKYPDPIIQKYGVSPTHYFLFELT